MQHPALPVNNTVPDRLRSVAKGVTAPLRDIGESAKRVWSAAKAPRFFGPDGTNLVNPNAGRAAEPKVESYTRPGQLPGWERAAGRYIDWRKSPGATYQTPDLMLADPRKFMEQSYRNYPGGFAAVLRDRGPDAFPLNLEERQVIRADSLNNAGGLYHGPNRLRLTGVTKGDLEMVPSVPHIALGKQPGRPYKFGSRLARYTGAKADTTFSNGEDYVLGHETRHAAHAPVIDDTALDEWLGENKWEKRFGKVPHQSENYMSFGKGSELAQALGALKADTVHQFGNYPRTAGELRRLTREVGPLHSPEAENTLDRNFSPGGARTIRYMQDLDDKGKLEEMLRYIEQNKLMDETVSNDTPGVVKAATHSDISPDIMDKQSAAGLVPQGNLPDNKPDISTDKSVINTPNAPASRHYAYQEAYDAWRADPTPDNMNAVVGKLQPVISSALVGIGGLDNPLLREQARIYAAEAVQKYDPDNANGAGLHTWTSRQLMQLRRVKRQSSQPLKIGDRAMLDAWHLHKVEQDFLDRNDREPDLNELADLTAIPVKRISELRARMRPSVSETSAVAAGQAGTETPDFAPEALDYVYQEADYTDRKILEMRLGYGGKHQPMSGKEVAARLKIHPAQVSRRAAKLAWRLKNTEADLERL